MPAAGVTSEPVTVEINTREHFSVLGLRRVSYQLDSRWHSGVVEALTYEIEELLGTKLGALYQRKRGRDLFDLSEALGRLGGLDRDRVLACFTRHVEHDGQAVSRAQFEANLAEKLTSDVFLDDVRPLISTGLSYDPVAAADLVGNELISRLPGEPWKGVGD